jgi:hypothetical protein
VRAVLLQVNGAHGVTRPTCVLLSCISYISWLLHPDRHSEMGSKIRIKIKIRIKGKGAFGYFLAAPSILIHAQQKTPC